MKIHVHHAEHESVEFSEKSFDSLEIADAPRILRASKAGYSRKKIVKVVADALIGFQIAAMMHICGSLAHFPNNSSF